MSKKKLAVKEALEFTEAVSYLEDLVKSYKEKSIVIEKGEDSVTLLPADFVEVELKAKQGKGKEKISLELSWQTPSEDEEEEKEEKPPLKISSNGGKKKD